MKRIIFFVSIFLFCSIFSFSVSAEAEPDIDVSGIVSDIIDNTDAPIDSSLPDTTTSVGDITLLPPITTLSVMGDVKDFSSAVSYLADWVDGYYTACEESNVLDYVTKRMSADLISLFIKADEDEVYTYSEVEDISDYIIKTVNEDTGVTLNRNDVIRAVANSLDIDVPVQEFDSGVMICSMLGTIITFIVIKFIGFY